MYTNIYFYLINKDNIDKFVELKQRMAEIVMGYGALEDHTYVTETIDGYFDCDHLISLLNVRPGEKVLLGQTLFRNYSHCQEVMEKVEKDEEIIQLTQGIERILDQNKVITASFACE